MEYLIVFWSVVPLLSVMVIYLYYKFGYAPYQVFRQLQIPGPTPTPLFGNYREIRQLGILEFHEALHRQYGPVTGYYLGQVVVFMVTDIDMVKQVFVKDFQFFTDRRERPQVLLNILPDAITSAKAEKWKIRRSIISPSFTTSKMKLMIPIIERNEKILMEVVGEAADTGRSVDISQIFSCFTMETIMATAFGRVVDVQRGEADIMTDAVKSLLKWFNGNTMQFGLFLISNFPWMDSVLSYFIGSNPAYTLLQNISMEIVRARRKEEKGKYKDLLQLLLDASLDKKKECVEDLIDKKNQRSTKLTDNEVVMMVIEFIMAGHETTANILAYASYLLALNPDIQKYLQKEILDYYQNNTTATVSDAITDIKYLDMVFQETIRLYTVIPIVTRVCNRATIVGGYRIPKDSIVLVPSHVLHKDPKYWPEPLKFDPLRFSAEQKARRPQYCHLPFGAGPRSCVGMRLALLECKMTLLNLMRSFSFVKSSDTEVPLKTIAGITLTPVTGIRLNITKLS